MGQKGAKLTSQTTEIAEVLTKRLLSVGEVSSRKMFGGYGIFESGKMFGIVNPKGKFFLKVDDSNRSQFEDMGSEQHGKMPYSLVPEAVIKDDPSFVEWASLSAKIAHK